MTHHNDTTDLLSGLSPGEKILYAARVIEGAAYELAGEVDANKVSGLMLVAAQLERTGNNAQVRRVAVADTVNVVGR